MSSVKNFNSEPEEYVIWFFRFITYSKIFFSLHLLNHAEMHFLNNQKCRNSFSWLIFRLFEVKILDHLRKGSPINDVTVLRGGGKAFCDDSTKVLVIKCWRWGIGVEKCSNLRDVIYGRPLSELHFQNKLNDPAFSTVQFI